jgi:ribosome-binding factor A
MVDHSRARKLAERIKVLVAESLERSVKDPDLGFVTITDVRCTPDLQHASIFYTVFGSDADKQRSKEIIEKNAWLIRKDVGRGLSIRLTPTVEFITDDIPETAAHLTDLLAEARARDEAVQKLAENAKPAGDANPYKEPRKQEETED